MVSRGQKITFISDKKREISFCVSPDADATRTSIRGALLHAAKIVLNDCMSFEPKEKSVAVYDERSIKLASKLLQMACELMIFA